MCRHRIGGDACISLAAPVELLNRTLGDPIDRFAAEGVVLECFVRKRPFTFNFRRRSPLLPCIEESKTGTETDVR